MTRTSHVLTDSATMARRDLRHAVRFPVITISGLLTPVIMLLLFDCVFGHALRAGLVSTLDRASYVSYLAPGILVVAAAGVAEATAISLNADMGEGLIARLRTMAIWRPSVLVGQVTGSLLRTLVTGAAVLAVALGLGFATHAAALAWLAATGIFALLGLALSWLAVAFGLLAKTPAGANSLALIPLFLPFVSSAFVPPAAMPAGVRVFAAHQPFTPIIDTLRGLLTGGPVGSSAIAAVAWCAGIALVGYLWAVALYKRPPTAAG